MAHGRPNRTQVSQIAGALAAHPRISSGAAWMALACAAAAGLAAAVVAPDCLYLLQPPLCLATAALALAQWRRERCDALGDRRLLIICAQVGLLQVALCLLAGVASGFRPSPRPAAFGSILPTLGLAGAQLLSLETARWCLVSVVSRRRAPLAVALAWLLPWGLQASVWLAGGPGLHPAHPASAGHTWLPAAAENLLAACMALLGGPLASLAYRGVLTAFAWLSPAVPNLTWASSTCLALCSLLIGCLAIADYTRRLRWRQRLEATVAGRTAELSRANARLRELSCHLVDMQESERCRIARELHDDTGQALAMLIAGLRLLEREADEAEAVRCRVAQLTQTADRAAESLHRLAADLRPPSLDRLGLVAALRQHAHRLTRNGLQVQLEALGLPKRLDPAMEIAIYRIVQEALTNVIRHAQASRADVLLHPRAGRLVAVIEDDGVGFDPQRIPPGRLGLLGMQERAEMLGGSLALESAPGAGTTVVVEVPYAGAHPDR